MIYFFIILILLLFLSAFFSGTETAYFHIRQHRGKLATGPKILVVGPGSEPAVLKKIIKISQNS